MGRPYFNQRAMEMDSGILDKLLRQRFIGSLWGAPGQDNDVYHRKRVRSVDIMSALSSYLHTRALKS
jgi:hypothetical protein